jgi:hypothetical protein
VVGLIGILKWAFLLDELLVLEYLYILTKEVIRPLVLFVSIQLGQLLSFIIHSQVSFSYIEFPYRVLPDTVTYLFLSASPTFSYHIRFEVGRN